jgi:transketolase
MEKNQVLEQIALKLRIHSLKMTTRAGSGHPTTCLSMADVAACLFFDTMRVNVADPFDWANDELVLSKGHAAPILWALYAEAGIIPVANLADLRKIESPLEGHPTPRMPWIKAATGSLGQGLSVGVGMAAALRLAGINRRVYVVMGDGECAEGSIWEAANSAADLGLANLCAVVDVNRLAQSQATYHGHDLEAYRRKFEAFGWAALVIDGHSIPEIRKALTEAGNSQRPIAILAKTLKGKGVSFIEDRDGWHGKPLKNEELEAALRELGPMPELDARPYIRKPGSVAGPDLKGSCAFEKTIFEKPTATRRAYGDGLLRLGRIHPGVVAVDGDVKNSTYAQDFFQEFPDRSFQSYIAEQNMVGMGIGLAAKGYLPFIATFAAFLTRAHDQIRMAAYSQSPLKLVGSHVGVSIGADGPSQMGLEDMALFTPIPDCVVLYPSDAFSAEACLQEMADYQGMAYLRTSRPATPLLYSADDTFPIGGSRVLVRSGEDRAAVIAAGVTVFEALKAAEELAASGISIRVIDAYSIKPIDPDICTQVEEAGNRAVVVEDHFPVGGLGSAAAGLLAGSAAVEFLAVREMPRSGEPEELMDRYGISARHIVAAVKRLVA